MSPNDPDAQPDKKKPGEEEVEASEKKLEDIALELANRKLEIRKVDERIAPSETNVFDK
ncbi:MAG: hypothetical protein MK297_10535 [Planctomycetes bacterium]|nr:hypothetical protein [Planctomycetota bacterium]